MLGQPISMLIPEVVGFRLTGRLREGITATDLVLTVTEMLRKKGVVGKFVEFFGPGLDHLPLADRATIGNMAPEYGATCGFFPIDDETLDYLRITGRDARADRAGRGLCQGAGPVARRRQPGAGLHRHAGARPRHGRAVASPARSGRRTASRSRKPSRGSIAALETEFKKGNGGGLRVAGRGRGLRPRPRRRGDRRDHLLHQHLQPVRDDRRRPARPQRAAAKGLKAKPWVKTSLAPGSQVVADYLASAGLQDRSRRARLQPRRLRLHHLHRQFRPAAGADRRSDQRRRPGRRRGALRQPQLRRPRQSRRAGQLPGLAAAGRRLCAGRLDACRPDHRAARHEQRRQAGLPQGHLADDEGDRRIRARQRHQRHVPHASTPTSSPATSTGRRSRWSGGQTYRLEHGLHLRPEPALFRRHAPRARAGRPTSSARGSSACFGDSITTDHISPAGSIKTNSPAGEYLIEHQVRPADFNSYGSRRGNHEVMMRGTFANIRIRNEMAPGVEGGVTIHHPDGEVMPIYDAAMRYQHGGRAAGGLRRQGVRHRLVARLGGQGHPPARRQGGDRRELRAHPPLQPGRHGRAAARLRGRRRRGSPSASTATRPSPSPASRTA